MRTKSYSLDLRLRVARFVESGHSCHGTARHVDVSVAFRGAAHGGVPGHRQPGSQTGGRLAPHRLDFMDETGTSTKMTRLRGRCLKAQRLYAKAPFGHGQTQTSIAGLRHSRLTAPWVIDGPMTGSSLGLMRRRNWRRPCEK